MQIHIEMSKLKKLTINSSSNVITSLLGNVISLVTLPFYLAYYGEVNWGIYLWAIAASGVLSGFDFGIKSGLRRFIARYKVNGDKKQVEIGLSLSSIIFGSIALLNALLIFIVSFRPDLVLNLPKEFIETGKYILLLSAAYSLSFWGKQLLESILEGHQLYVIKNINILISQVCLIAVFIYAINSKPNFVLLVALLFLARSLIFFFHLGVILYRGLLKELTFKFNIKKADFKSDFFKFSFDVFLLAILQILIFKADRFILGAILGSSFITIYIVITKPMFIIKTLDSFIFSAIQPMIAQEHAKKNSKFIIDVIEKGGFINFMLLSPLCIFVAIMLEPFLSVWLGTTKYGEFVIWGQIASLMYMIRPFYGVITKVMLNIGETKSMVYIKLIFAIVTFSLSIIFTYYFDVGGVVLGSLIGMAINVPLYYNLVIKTLKISIKKLLSKSILVLHIYIGILGFSIYYFVQSSTIDSWWSLIFYGGAVFLVLYGYSFFELWHFYKRIGVSKKQPSVRPNTKEQ